MAPCRRRQTNIIIAPCVTGKKLILRITQKMTSVTQVSGHSAVIRHSLVEFSALQPPLPTVHNERLVYSGRSSVRALSVCLLS